MEYAAHKTCFSQGPDNIDMLGPRGQNVDSQQSLCEPNVGNPYVPNATLLVGSTLNQYDGSTSGQRLVIVGSMAYPRL